MSSDVTMRKMDSGRGSRRAEAPAEEEAAEVEEAALAEGGHRATEGGHRATGQTNQDMS